jgi:hypothetical protein
MKRFAVYSGCALLLIASVAEAATIAIGTGARRLIFRVGAGTGAANSPNATINVVTFTVPAANVGDGTPIAGTVAPASPTCPANTVIIDAQARATAGAPSNATITANSSTALTTGVFTIPFTQISWTSSTPGGIACLAAPVTIPSGTFTGGAAQSLYQAPGSFGTSQQACVCQLFNYLNQNIVSAGTYTGRVTYTLSMP